MAWSIKTLINVDSYENELRAQLESIFTMTSAFIPTSIPISRLIPRLSARPAIRFPPTPKARPRCRPKPVPTDVDELEKKKIAKTRPMTEKQLVSMV